MNLIVLKPTLIIRLKEGRRIVVGDFKSGVGLGSYKRTHPRGFQYSKPVAS